MHTVTFCNAKNYSFRPFTFIILGIEGILNTEMTNPVKLSSDFKTTEKGALMNAITIHNSREVLYEQMNV